MIQNVSNRLKELLLEVPGKIRSIPEDKMNSRPSPDKWSKKELLGHLCDSAVNNLSRFIRAQYEEQPFPIVTYEQEEWVRINNYRSLSLDHILKLWEGLNSQLISVISGIDREKLNYTIDLNGEFHTLGWLIEDYLNHMEHHLDQIFETISLSP